MWWDSTNRLTEMGALGQRGVVVGLATWPLPAVQIAGFRCSDLPDDFGWSRLGYAGENFLPVCECEAVRDAACSVTEQDGAGEVPELVGFR